MIVTRQSSNEGQTAAVGRAIARLLRSGDVVRLEGELGAGKTTLVRAVAAGLGVDPGLVSSPTFVIVNQYPVRVPGRAGLDEVVHVDAYRLTTAEDLESVGWDRLTDAGTRGARAGSVMLVEWPERVEGALPRRDACLVVGLRATGETAREVTLEIPGAWKDRPEAALIAEREPVRCRVTGVWVDPASPTYPFADERAKMADLGRWFSGSYRISRDAGPDELEGA